MAYSFNYAQDPQLFENDWYLHELIIDGESHLPPSNDEVEYIPLNFYSDKFSDRFDTIVCEGLTGDNITISAVDIFVESFLILIDEPCNLTENNEYESLYYGGFFHWQEANKTFDYEITESDNTLTLTLINEDGNVAMYGNKLLASQGFENTQTFIYPNPVQKILYIENETAIIKKISVYDVLGKVLLQKGGNTSQINLENLSSGLLFVMLETDQGIFTKKVVKN